MNPLQALRDYQKLAAKKPVKAYIRRREGKIEQVDAHQREVGEGEEKEAPSVAVPDFVAELSAKKQKEVDLWKTWKAGGKKPSDLRPLIKSFQPMIQSRANVFKHGQIRISPAAIDAEFYKQALAAFETWDETKGGALGTWLYRYLDKAKRFIYQHQNVARIPEHRITKIREFQAAEQELEAQAGRPATDVEMAGYLKWPIKEISRMSQEIRRDLWSHSEQWEENPYTQTTSRESDVLTLIRYELNEDEQKVYKQLITKEITSTSKIAKKTGFDIYKVSRLKKAIAAKMEKHLK